MNRTLLVLWVITLAACATLLITAGTGAARARAVAADAGRDLTTIADQASELAQLRDAGTDLPERPEGGLPAKVSATMSRAGLANTVLQSLSPEAQAAAGVGAGATFVRQRATITLAGLSLPQVGKFLDAWRGAEPCWIVSNIDLTPITGKDTPSIGADLPLRAVITLEGVFKGSAARP